MGGGIGIIDRFLGTFTQYIDSGFGLVQGDVRWLAGVLIAIDITLAGLFWAMAPDEDLVARLVRKTLSIGFFAFLIGNFNNLAQIVFNSFAGLGLEAGGGTLSQAQLLEPGRLAEIGIDAGKPILAAISNLTGYVAFFENFIQIVILLLAWLVVVISFFIMAIQLFVSLLEFKLTTLAGFVLVPFGLFGRTAFLAEKVLGNVVSSGVKILVLAVIVGIGSTIFGQFTSGSSSTPTISDALTVILAALSLLGLSIFGPGIANGLIAGGPQLGAGAAAGTGLAATGFGAAGALGLGAAGGAAAAAARGGAWLAGGAVGAWRAGAAGTEGAVAGIAAGAANVGKEGALAALSPLRRAAASLKERFDAGAQAGGGSPASGTSGPAGGEPGWAARMRRRQARHGAASATSQALRAGDQPSSGASIDLSEEE
jgi:type IV secretion system protein TrbL